jgi:hypothetical protein
MQEPTDTEPGRKTAGTVVILAADTIGAVAPTSWETTGPWGVPDRGAAVCRPVYTISVSLPTRDSGVSGAVVPDFDVAEERAR